eukprot:1321770-Pleurochrysis_carterae.AAC.1
MTVLADPSPRDSRSDEGRPRALAKLSRIDYLTRDAMSISVFFGAGVGVFITFSALLNSNSVSLPESSSSSSSTLV